MWSLSTAEGTSQGKTNTWCLTRVVGIRLGLRLQAHVAASSEQSSDATLSLLSVGTQKVHVIGNSDRNALDTPLTRIRAC